MRPTALAPDDSPPDWLARFHAGEPALLGECYRAHFDAVSRAVGSVLTGADRETVVHDVFLRLVSQPSMRSGFQGGSLEAWLCVVARRQALDFARSRARESAVVERFADETSGAFSGPDAERLERRLEAQRQVERFRKERLPAKWAPVFEAIFLRGLSQREAAAELGLSRTTLAYQELRVRHLLKKFFLAPEGP
ncbi:RNA polymerase sigma factor [Archangium lansingense]|uniref:Sigma-70 family RNA polymerase sigma factor n=1 Tax=Archangium lansingense TaxID=2995310 RepID=A0ABT3ZWN6_9BACT|nr:sigma-70 family RNA polymerase sigma factor [Archangium lansinium]MCY1073164.1 sigma-70 family RNA polymerase sigma factor [Archangium lansinium]